MYAVDAGSDPAIVNEVTRLAQTGGLALVTGWIADRALGVGLHIRGLALLCGLAGLSAGSWLWATAGWPLGPLVGDHALVPALAGALAVALVFKMAALGAAGPRR